MKKFIVALDQGTTSSRAILFDRSQNIAATAQKPLIQYYPAPGWVEHDPLEILSTQLQALREAMSAAGAKPGELAGIGIANQRETAVLWDKQTGQPVCNAIVWQCRRTAPFCEELRAQGLQDLLRERTGLVLDAYFSATKLRWVLDNVPGVRERANRGEILFGTVDSWLIWNLSGGKLHITDYTNASRTMLFNIHTLRWDEEICSLLGIPVRMLPEVRSCSEVYGEIPLDGTPVPIAGIAGDQQAALFGQCCFERGDVKNTYGTGCFLLMHTGDTPCPSGSGLLTTIAYHVAGKTAYALEGSVFIAGALMQWLRDEIRILVDSPDAEYYAGTVEDSGGVYIVPAFTGLGAPYWDMYARGGIFGITRGTKRAHIIRAAEEAIAYQCKDLLDAVAADTGSPPAQIRVDGGACRDDFLMQFQADILNCPVQRPAVRETTALGAAFLAGLATGFWRDAHELRRLRREERLFLPDMGEEKREKLLRGWKKAVERSMRWEEA